MNEKDTEIINQTMQFFMTTGIKSATMDDVSRHLGISKKTLYTHVKDKNDLVEKALMCSCEMQNSEIDLICKKNLNAIDESFEISNYIFKHINTIHPSIVYDLQKYHMPAWEKFKTTKQAKIYDCYSKNMIKGIKEGLYRDDLNIPVVVKIYASRFDVIFDENLFPREEFRPADLYLELFRYHIRGIACEKGIQYLIKKVKKEKLKS